MGRGYLTVAIRRKMNYPLKGYVPMSVRQSMSANENIFREKSKLNVYSENDLYNPDLLPANVQSTYNDASKELKKYFDEDSQRAYKDSLIKAINTEFKLNLNDEKDMQVFADVMRVFNFDEKPHVSSSNSGVYVNGSYKNSIHNSTSISINPYNIKIINNSFSTDKEKTPNGVAYAMITRQLAAAKEIAKRTNKPVVIEVHAVNSFNLVGLQVWPKLGYNFLIETKLPTSGDGWNGGTEHYMKTAIKNKYKDIVSDDEMKKIKSTATLMLNGIPTTQKDRKGKQIVLNGYDVWNEVSKEAKGQQLVGFTEISPKLNVQSRAEQVTRQYGRKKGFVKSLSPSKDFSFDKEPMSASEDNVFRNIWRNLRKK